MGFGRRLGTPPNLLGVTIIWRGESRVGVLGRLPKTTHVLSNPTSGSDFHLSVLNTPLLPESDFHLKIN
ncbi:MAG: hypothetical protein A3F82_07015 [Deltaproteobacteria bacterium RIFCSPLOWO2_12_FULL_44_12]|nr:MAG: hypothetical protein A2712_09850 [Deltaproteobacteria bacterium RIFCSPHIGHO2_01_FULL_43_49]OGQ15415.1 MAG: hypothetical protein A3D22_10380 [Deltaproteobacteria bacterium RIFCSPHIGHO2_02_FULL_44_53]OGQ29608.1 MAG: hypothetical protein A3D98_10580 [Deltaproteobacteria bacterium RIFCSPHIGHO2_12_FULL_44_21]OGQ32221.1 MAG: hypothetical protein A2979_00225 [Deltaproteobacteria bacterium RIFCSPLOWO2_01_FULL_45_74]OGQ43863.1 MAG: hypothetical protein A3I70_04120 [Deltaproteobacteria bacterium 